MSTIKEQEIKLEVHVAPTDNLVVSDAAVPALIRVGRTFEISVPVTNNDVETQTVSGELQGVIENEDGTEGTEEIVATAGPTTVESNSSVNLTFAALSFPTAGKKDIDITIKAG